MAASESCPPPSAGSRARSLRRWSRRFPQSGMSEEYREEYREEYSEMIEDLYEFVMKTAPPLPSSPWAISLWQPPAPPAPHSLHSQACPPPRSHWWVHVRANACRLRVVAAGDASAEHACAAEFCTGLGPLASSEHAHRRMSNTRRPSRPDPDGRLKWGRARSFAQM